MSKLKFILLVTLSFGFLNPNYAQENTKNKYHTRVTYHVSFSGDSTSVDRKTEEDCYLFLGDSGSLSESVNSFDTSTVHKNEMIRLEKGLVRLTWAVWKDENEIRTYDSFSPIREDKDWRFVYTEPASLLDWKLEEETKTIEGFACQKATCELGGRTWVAWFSSEIPFNSGPYKFGGLPGLIISISDAQNHWQFTIKGVERFKDTDIVVPMNFFTSYKETSKEKFFEDQHYYRENFLELEEAKGINFINPENRAIIKENVELGFKQSSNWIELY